jgi:GNAT superfamily N-acetyltransferase
MGEVTIRRAVEEDVTVLRALIEASVRGLGSQAYTTGEVEGAVGQALGLDTQLIEDGTYFIAETAEGRSVGCGGWSYRQKLCGGDGVETGCGAGEGEGGAKIRAIYVHPEWARRGLGSEILARCEEAAMTAGFRRLEMGSTLTGVPLYTLRGYLKTGRMRIALPNGESLAVVKMVKEV